MLYKKRKKYINIDYCLFLLKKQKRKKKIGYAALALALVLVVFLSRPSCYKNNQK
jgi:hypothetical protein